MGRQPVALQRHRHQDAPRLPRELGLDVDGQARRARPSSGRPQEVTSELAGVDLSWSGSTVVLLAGGQSLTVAQCDAVSQWRGAGPMRRCIAINTTYQRALWADVLYACDLEWWELYANKVGIGEWPRFDGDRWTQDERAAKRFGIRYVKSQAAPGLGRRPGLIHQGGNGGYQAMNLAYQAGASRLVLLGFDMHGGHWHGQHPRPLSNPPPYLFATWLKAFIQLATDLQEEGVQVVNCTPGTALHCFPKADLEEALGVRDLQDQA